MAAKNKTVEITLTNGKKVKFNPDDANGHALMKAREAAGGMATVIYLICEIAEFDGEKLPAPEVLNFSAFDIIALEEAWSNSRPNS